ncbi:LamG-like jellyroll fold domain-containing protein [Allokutzneria albata]|uniref:Concanavalin A-like lectin/glucanases superfamily protein n=1 Tax=Allokutzneria albata TaxID=211114 RepID=A0A1G9SZU5_ALLAB|nr:LamG-like jellyroll fold domain-containing protein [Allokutzneria albata]SDM40930.1 Concanavalin A-like lectin/glucanases superfamily protein [Allokutzneria albata]
MTASEWVWPSTDCNGIALVDPVAVGVEGTTVVFARQAGTPVDTLYYNVREPGAEPLSPAEWAGWNRLELAPEPPVAGDADREPLLRLAGMDLITVDPVATTPAPADAPFRVVSDGRNICCFRLSQLGSLYLDRFVLVQNPQRRASGDRDGAIPSSWSLRRLGEVRYRRSQRRDVPAGPADSLGATNMAGAPFLEPTIELSLLLGSDVTRFDVALGWTGEMDVQRWHIVTTTADHQLNYLSCKQGEFDPMDLDASSVREFGLSLAARIGGARVPLGASAGPAVALYAEQESAAVGGTSTNMRRGTRLAITVPVVRQDNDQAAGLAVLDFTVFPDGTVPQPLTTPECVVVDETPSASGYPVPDAAVHAIDAGTVNAVLLSRPRPAAAPALLDSADGLLHCYFAETDDEFAVAQFDPTMVRARLALPWSAEATTGTFPLVARRSGSTFNDVTVQISECGTGTAPDLCAVRIVYGPDSGLPEEYWDGVPRALSRMIPILNGGYSEDPSDAEVQSGQRQFYDEKGRRAAARLPLTSVPGGPQVRDAYLELLSHRENVSIQAVDLAVPQEGSATLTIHYSLPGNGVARQTWAGLPTDTEHLVAVLSGAAAPARYSYTPDPNDTPLYAIEAGSGILLFDHGPRELTLTVSAATNQDPAYCDISLTVGGQPQPPRTNVPRAPAAFAEAVGAWFLAVSVDPTAGPVPDQTVSAPLDLRSGSLLFDLLLPVPTARLAPAATTVTAAKWQRRTVGVLPPGVTLDRGMLALTAVPPAVPPGQDPTVDLRTSSVITKGDNGKWLTAAKPDALGLDGASAVSVPEPGASVIPVRDWTMESWLRPGGAEPAAVLAYWAGHPPAYGDLWSTYYLGTSGLPTLRFDPYRTTHGQSRNSYLALPSNAIFDLTRPGFTWEAWIRPDERPCPADSRAGLVQVHDTKDEDSVPLGQICLTAERGLTFGFRDDSGKKNVEQMLEPSPPLPANTWTHVAVTAQRQPDKDWRLVIYVNAQEVRAADIVLRAASHNTPPAVVFGSRDDWSASLFGAVTEMRFWTFARPAADLRQSMETALTGTEPGLAGYWTFSARNAANGTVFGNQATATGSALDAVLKLNPAQPVSFSAQDPFIGVIATVGFAPPVHARAFLKANEWNHVCVAYRAVGALRLNPSHPLTVAADYGSCKEPNGFDFNDEFTVEAWVMRTDDSPLDQTVLAQWSQARGGQSFRFGFTPAGALSCEVNLVSQENGDRVAIRVNDDATVPCATPTHVAATLSTATVAKDASTHCTLVLYVNGKQGRSATTVVKEKAGVRSVGSRSPVTVGVAVPPSPTAALEAQAPFHGVVTGVRFSSVALGPAEVSAAMSQRRGADADSAVVAAWWFDETGGTIAADSVGDNDLVLTTTDLWASFPSLGTFEFYRDGQPIGTVLPVTDGLPSIPKQFTIGAVEQGGEFVNGFSGSLAELRLWRSARSRAQVVDGLYRRVAAGDPDLAAYWSFDATTEDLTGRGSDGVLEKAARFVPSAAPVANEGPQVRNVYDGPTTRFHSGLTGRPAVLEYPETATRWDGRPVGVMRRAYLFTAPELVLATGFGIGELALVYLGQVQTNPTLIGFIEGAPPVPSENLSRPLYNSPLGYNSYQDTATVTLRSTETTSFSFTSSDYRTTLTMKIDGKAGLSGGLKLTAEYEVPILNKGINVEVANVKLKIGGQHKSDLEQAQQTNETFSSGWTRTTTDAVGLRGRWEPPSTPGSPYLNPVVGRRYQPLNVGYALVESLTADLYALRLDSTGAMVGKVVLPDLDIPPDRNIITFRMRPTYVKNGTLDGRVGLVNDPDYPQADVTHGSYFQPAEAYRLAARIDRADQLARARFRRFDAESRGDALPGGRHSPESPDLDEVGDEQFYDFARQVPARGIANRYVWTATGGLHTETEQFSATHDRSFTGFYDYTWLLGPTFNLEGEGGPWWKVGGYASLDALFGGHIKIQLGKEEKQSQGMSLDVTCPGEPMLQAYDDSTGFYTTDPCPGKVDAYRFMAFYLPPSAEGGAAFRQVVDPAWLDTSSDPNAVALRNVRFTGNGVWRVLYRVTYVSRVPPRFDTNPDQTAKPVPEQAILLADNPLLISLVEQAIAPGEPTPATIGAAVAAVLVPATVDKPYALGAKVQWWQHFVDSTRGPDPDRAAARMLDRIVQDAITYFQAGYASGVLPRTT